MSTENTIVIPIGTRLDLQTDSRSGLVRVYSPEESWSLGATFLTARLAIQCTQITAGAEITAGIDWSVDGRNWVSEDAASGSFYPATGGIGSPGTTMSQTYRLADGPDGKFGPYTRFWVELGATSDLSAVITASVICRTE